MRCLLARIIIFGFLGSIYFGLPRFNRGLPSYAKVLDGGCSNRFVTLVNPVRGRELWAEKTLKPISDQYQLVQNRGLVATWLLQYDVLKDPELLQTIDGFDRKHEKGVFLEISQELANDARVIYPAHTPWFSPKAVFLSGYTQSERRALIDKIFEEFKLEFKSYPKSVGAWWIDAYSLDYMRKKYGIKSAMIVADQKTTDNYGVWGQWWGVPYYPSKANILVPAPDLKNKQDVVVIQWAQRDLLGSYGEGWEFSNNSLQANDYIRLGKNIDYFKDLSAKYLDCALPVGQITVGLETGQEAVGYIDEYGRQLDFLKTLPSLQSVTMSEFADKFKTVYPGVLPVLKLGKGEESWELDLGQRSNKTLADSINYDPNISFKDFFLADKSDFLDRKLPVKTDQTRDYRIWIFLWILSWFIFYKLKKLLLWIGTSTFVFASFGLILRSFAKFGWKVFFGPVWVNLELLQSLVLAIPFLVVWLISNFKSLEKFKPKIIWVICLSFGIDALVKILRYSRLGDKHLFGIATDTLHLSGISLSKNFTVELVNQDLPPVVAGALLKFNFDNIWNNLWVAVLIYPLIHVLVGLVIFFLLRRAPKTLTRLSLAILIVLCILHMLNILGADPRAVLASPDSIGASLST